MVHAKPAAVNSGRYLIDKNGPLYFYISDGKLGASLYNGSAVWPSVAGAQTIVADRWYSFMMVYNGSTIRTFVNGQLDGTTSHSEACKETDACRSEELLTEAALAVSAHTLAG
jgi:hypothetical protein